MKPVVGNLKNHDFFNKINSIVMMVTLAGILVLVNIIAEKLPWAYDMTAEKIYTLSDQTQKVINQLNRQITMIAFYQEGMEDPTIKSLLEEYRKAGKGKIGLEYIDAEKNPAAAKKYDLNNESISNGSIIIVCDGKAKKISQFEMFTSNAYGRTFSGEQQFTGAIIHLTAQKFSKVDFLEGHQEMNPNKDLSTLKGRIESEASVVESLNLLKSNSVLKNVDIMVIASPKRDINVAEMANLQKFLEKGGRAIFMFDVLGPSTQLPNFNNLLKVYGITIKNNFVAEENSESFYANRKNYLVPEYTEQRIVSKLKSENLAVFFPYAGNIDILKEVDPTVTVEPLLRSTSKSWIRYHVTDTHANKTDSDQSGPAILAVAITKDNSELKYPKTKIIVIYNARFAMDEMIDVQGNYDFIMNTFSWVQDKEESIAIRPKMMGANLMFVKGAQSVILMIVSIIVIPMVAFGTGLLVWLRRRHR
jgi:ABC-type uncharacterized transport system involved in gliding motility auxiliary subunit